MIFAAVDFIKRKKDLFVLLGIFVLIYLLIKLLIFFSHSLSVFEFAFISMIFGLAPSYFMRRVFNFESIIGWLVNSSVLGILFIPFLFIVLGWMGVNLVFVYSTFFLYACSLLGFLLLLIFADNVFVREYCSFSGVSKVDAFFYIVLVFYTFILTLQNFHRVYVQWDAFTFWGLDAKYIFQLNKLRDASLDVFGQFSYTSFYPVYYSIIYDLYGTVAEQYANWINIFLNLLALLLIYNNVVTKDRVYKLFIVTLLVVVSYAAFLTVYMLSMYADVLCAFILLLFMLVLTAQYEYNLETYSRRMFLLLMLLTSLYFIKSPFIFLASILAFVYGLYDLKLLANHWKILIKRFDFWLAIVNVLILYALRFYYFTVVLKIESSTPINDLYSPHVASLYLAAKYTYGLISWLFNRSPYLVGLWLLGAGSVFLMKAQRLGKNYWYIYFVSNLILFSYCFVYIMNQSDLTSGSLVRYCAIMMYLVPLMFASIRIESFRVKPLAFAAAFFFLSAYIFFKTMTPMPLRENFSLSTGSYNIVLRKESRIAEKTLRLAGNTSRILIVDDIPNSDLLGNMNIDAIFVRYFLMFNSVGGQYATTIDRLYDYAMSQEADYILLLSYANAFDGCENLFFENRNYLIKIDKNISYSLGTCPFSNSIVFDLVKE